MEGDREIKLMVALMLPHLGVQGCWLFAAHAVAMGKERTEFLAECTGIYDEVAAIGSLGAPLDEVIAKVSSPPDSTERPKSTDDPDVDP